MPRHRTLTGRSERQRRRNIYSRESQNDNRPNANLNSVNSITLTGRSERQGRRNIYSRESQNDNRPNANLNSVNSITCLLYTSRCV